MPRPLLAACLFLLAAPLLAQEPRATVCTITVNSADERDVLRDRLPASRYDFVELVERGRRDWLASACRRQVSCDVLVVSGHFAGTEFYSSRFDVDETLPVEEMQRAICSEGCPSLFSNLKEVYLFGCDTLKPEPVKSATPEIVRGLVRGGMPRAEAERAARALSERHGESSRELMRRLFAGVPVIYGFASLAPLGRVAGPMLRRHLEAGGGREFGTARVDEALVRLFAPSSMVVTSGQRDDEPNADFRRHACGYYDDRQDLARKASFVHGMLAAPMPELRMEFDRVERFFASLPPSGRAQAAARFAAVPGDAGARERYLRITRETGDPALRLRMVALARAAGWLDAPGELAEQALAVGDVLAGEMGFAEVELVCALERDGALRESLRNVLAQPQRRTGVAHDAARACLGDEASRGRVLRALASDDESEVQVVQAFLRHRPIVGGAELREAASRVAAMKGGPSQARALETLARQHLADPEILGELARLFARTGSARVQHAIAEVFLRCDPRTMDSAALLPVLRRHRLKSPHGSPDLVETLIGRLQS